ncbi:MAG: hypothetical protein ACC608_00590 [Anaerofustis sp.]
MGRVIGFYIDPVTGDKCETTIGIIHYYKTEDKEMRRLQCFFVIKEKKLCNIY